MGFVLLCFILVTLFCGFEFAAIVFGSAIILGFIIGTYKHFKNRP